MNPKSSLALEGLHHKLSDMVGLPSPLPFSVTLSVTRRCNSKCRACNIWKLPDRNGELEAWEWDKLIAQIGPHIKFYTISGGEPFLREDLPEILYLPFKYGRPQYLTLSTNGLLPERIRDQLENFLLRLDRKTPCTVYCNLSVDAVGSEHDKLRGVEGNFSKLCDTLGYLEKIRARTNGPRLRIGIHTVLSKLNVDEVQRICDFFLPLKNIDSLICEIAEQRNELHNTENSLSPSREEFVVATKLLVDRLSHEKSLDRTVLSLRIGYYEFVDRWLMTRKQPLRCFAGRSSCQVTPNGEITSCAVRWTNDGFMGSLREERYDFHKIWRSDQARRIRNSIKKGECACPLCNAYYGSLICSPLSLAKTMLRHGYLKGFDMIRKTAWK